MAAELAAYTANDPAGRYLARPVRVIRSYASLTVAVMEPEAEKVMYVHRQTAWPVLRCREVLTQTAGDVGAAIRTLREQHQTYMSEEQKAELEKSGSWVDRLREVSKMVDTTKDLARIREYFAARIAKEAAAADPDDDPISAVVVALRLCQAGFVLLHFDRDNPHEPNDAWIDEMEPESNMLELPHWSKAYMSSSDGAITVRMPDGIYRNLPAGSADETVAGAFGEAVRLITLDLFARGEFGPLDLRPDCQLDIDEFDGMWRWPRAFEDAGKTNVLRKLPAVRLPE